MADAAAAIPSNPIVVDILDSYGALIIGNFFACVLWGIACMQIFLYFFHYPKDHWGTKALVLVVMAADTANQILMLKSVFPVLISQYGRIEGLFEVQNELLHHSWVAGIVAVGVQLFFLTRIYKFNHSWIFPVIMLPVIAYQIIGTIPYNVLALQSKSLATITLPRQVAISTSLRASMAAVDVFIAIAMAYELSKHRNSTFESSQNLVYRLIFMTINTGMWTAVFALAVLSTQLLLAKTLIFCVFEFPLSSLYVNTLMANLNARRYVREGRNARDGSEAQWASANPNPNAYAMASRNQRPTMSNVSPQDTLVVEVTTSKSDGSPDFKAVKF